MTGPRADDPPGTVLVLGGGSAGYLTALALRRRLPRLRVRLLESDRLPVIGVGEATTPLMPQFLHVDLGLDVHDFFRRVRPTFKLGIRFLWGPDRRFDFNYPFGALRLLEPQVYDGRLDNCSLQSRMMSAGVVPQRPSVVTAYHLDNARFLGYLRDEAERCGVERAEGLVEDVVLSEDGSAVRSVSTADGRSFSADLYVDCSGFRSLLLGALGSTFLSYCRSLFTDRAVVATVPQGRRIGPFTGARAMSSGWLWSTPQGDEDHRGYVFCSSFIDTDRAAAEMRRTSPAMADYRVIEFRPGRREHFWKGNVVAMGNAYGFVEPLESTSLHMLIRQIGLLSIALATGATAAGARSYLNRRVGAWWDYLAWFLALHYRFNRALDTPFWDCCRREADVSRHGELLEAFRAHGPLSCNDAIGGAFSYPDPLAWGPEGIDLILLGQGVGAKMPSPALGPEEWRARVRALDAAAARGVPHRQALQTLETEPEHLDAFVAALRKVGPAFDTSTPARRPAPEGN